jgi:plastocyanin
MTPIREIFGSRASHQAVPEASGTRWPTVLRWAALAGVVEAIVVMIYVEKGPVPPALLLAVVLLIGVVLLGQSRRAGVWVTTIASALLLFAGLVLNGPQLAVAASFGSFAVNWITALTGLVGVIAGVASWRDRPPSTTALRVAVGAGGVAVLMVVIGVVASLSFTDARLTTGDVVVKASGSKFRPATLTVPSGQVTFFLNNTDNTLHDFHIVGVKEGDKDMPANHQVALTVNLTPGTYKYKCDLHNNMTGTLTVR